jgi:hypothetical protein
LGAVVREPSGWGVVADAVLPAAPQYAGRGAAEDADGVWVVAAAAVDRVLVDVVGPGCQWRVLSARTHR